MRRIHFLLPDPILRTVLTPLSQFSIIIAAITVSLPILTMTLCVTDSNVVCAIVASSSYSDISGNLGKFYKIIEINT